jgi:hypothetical protein
MAKTISDAEERARRVLEKVLGRSVTWHDDGRLPGRYDLRVGSADAPEIAIECVGAVDPQRTETWNIGPARRPETLDLHSDWSVVLQPSADVKAVRKEIERILQRCESIALLGFTPVDWWLRRQRPELYAALSALRIESIHCLRIAGAGRLDLAMTGIGGAVDEEGSALPSWVSEFLRDPARADVLTKLGTSAAVERHVFIPVSFGGAPWFVESYLGTTSDVVPTDAPDLPVPVTAVWLTYGARGVRWNGQEWLLFDASADEL